MKTRSIVAIMIFGRTCDPLEQKQPGGETNVQAAGAGGYGVKEAAWKVPEGGETAAFTVSL